MSTHHSIHARDHSLPVTVEEEEEEAGNEGDTEQLIQADRDTGASNAKDRCDGEHMDDISQPERRASLRGSKTEGQELELDVDASNTQTPTDDSSRLPAAGVGTRVRPRPAPRSSTSLRHISSRGRTVSFGAAVPEDHAAGEIPSTSNGTSTLQRRFEAAQRKTQDQLQSESAMESDAEDTDQDEQYETRRSASSRESKGRSAQHGSETTLNGLTTSSDDASDDSTGLDAFDQTFEEGDSTRDWDAHGASEAPTAHSGVKRDTTESGPGRNDDDPNSGEGAKRSSRSAIISKNRVDTRHRLEWHTMLQSVLRSEVLKSETKRITSADAPSLSDKEVMYQRWLDIRASLRGRGDRKNAYEVELKRLEEGWPILIAHVIEEIDACRSSLPQKADGEDGSLVENDVHNVQQEVGKLLTLVDNAEIQFPSLRKLAEVAPAYFDDKIQNKLAALYSWYNILSSLQLQLMVLQHWTGSESLDIQSTPTSAADPAKDEETKGRFSERLEEGTFLERLLKENSLQSTFEKRTLRALYQLVMKAKLAITEHHKAFNGLHLPTFLPQLMQLINFPTRLMEAALRARLDYVGKLTDPSVLIVDSLIDDLRGAIALACRIKVQYTEMIVPDSEHGWEPPQDMGESYDAVLREALRYFFKLLNYKLKGSLFFKETEILEPEWRFLTTAVQIIEGADILIARRVTKMVNKLFIRIVNYFERELSAPSVRKSNAELEPGQRALNAIGGGQNAVLRGPSIAGGLTKGQVRMTLDEKARWIHQVFDSVRIRSRKLLGFARDIRNRLENAAEYDLTSLRSPYDERYVDQNREASSPPTRSQMDLTQFLQTLIDAGFFLVLTGSFEQEGIYVLAEPSLHDRPEMVLEIFCKCMQKSRNESDILASGQPQKAKTSARHRHGEDVGKDDDSDGSPEAVELLTDDDEPARYLLALSPRDAFMWTGRVMYLEIDRLDINLKDRRLRLIADGSQSRLKLCQHHLYSVFGASHARLAATGDDHEGEDLTSGVAGDNNSDLFPLNVLDQSLAHMSAVQSELRQINKGVYLLTNAVLRSVPKIRRNLRLRRKEKPGRSRTPQGTEGRESEREWPSKGGDCDELIQTCFSRAAEQGLRALPFIESAKLRAQTMLALARLAIDWVAFICDDCEPTDRRTFKYAVAALEMGMFVTKSEGILNISEQDFLLMRSKVASCVGLLISHFDILGARDSAAKAKAEEERLERERADRNRAIEAGPGPEDASFRAEAVRAVEGACCGPPPMLDRHDSGMQATEERWVQKVMEWDAARQAIDSEQHLIGRVLDDTRLEDRGLQFLASSSSRIQIRWQQGRFIGGGTFGTVYLGVNLDSGGLMAVKEIRLQDINSTPTMYKQIKDEMSVMEMLSHPNIVEYYGIEVHRDKVYIFEEYCQGGSLAQLLEHGRIEDEMVSQVYTLQMLDGLVYLHSKDVVHRDIKPDNILLDHMGVIKFVDFGAAKVLAKNSRTIQLSKRPAAIGAGAMAGMIGPDGKPAAAASLQGTPMYMSPEVIKGESRGRRGAMDVWSLGCVVLECATGQRPWSQLDNEWAIMFHIGMAQQHPPLPEPGQLSELGIDFIRQCLIIDPYERPSAAEMREHPWIKNLVEELNAANEFEIGPGSAVAETPGVESLNILGSGFIHGTDTAAGVAAMAATPGTRTVNGFSFGRAHAPSFNSSGMSSFSRGSSETSVTGIGASGTSHFSPPLNNDSALTPSMTTISNGDGESAAKESSSRAQHDPGHPNHKHPGSKATIADMAYAKEDEEKRIMQTPSETGDE